MGGTDTAYAVSPGPAGTIVAAGVSVQGGSNYDALIRLTSAGALDTTFNSTGKILGSSGSGTIRAILVQTNGEILAGGDASSGTAQKVWMFTPAGAADTAFASGGTLTANSGATVYGWAVASGATQRIVVAGSYGGDEALAAFAPASLRLYAQQDANYNVTAMVDSNGNVVQRYLFDSYGNMSVLSAAWTPQSDLFNTQVGFQGMWLDAASGLYHTPNRDYSAALGRWMEQDPAGYVDGSNRYEGFQGTPVSLLDPAGTFPIAVAPDPQTAFPQTTFPIMPVYEDHVPLHLSAGINVIPHLSSNPADSYFGIQVSVSRSIDTAAGLDQWNTAVAQTLPASAAYSTNNVLDANLLLFVNVDVLGSAARAGQDYLEVDAEASGGDIERGWPSYQTTRSWHATDGQQPPAYSYAAWRNLSAAQKEAWTSAMVNSVTSSELDFPLPCEGSGHVNLNLFHGERARFGNKDWGDFVVNWSVDSGGRFVYNVVQNQV